MAEVLVTGASGFIGSWLVPLLIEGGHRVTAVDETAGDVADESTWDSFPRAEVVVHLAARSFAPDSWAEPSRFLRDNLLGVQGALEYCRGHGARLVFPSTYLYGRPVRLPVAESAEVVASSPYALSKKLGEDVCEFYARHFGVDVTILRPFNVYGPGQSDHFLIPFVVGQLKAGSSIRVKDLDPKRDYVYVTDLVEAIRRVVERPAGFRVLNVGSGESHSVAEIIEILQRLAGTSLPVVSAGERRPAEVMDCRADISAARRELGWAPVVPLEDGLRRVLDG